MPPTRSRSRTLLTLGLGLGLATVAACGGTSPELPPGLLPGATGDAGPADTGPLLPPDGEADTAPADLPPPGPRRPFLRVDTNRDGVVDELDEVAKSSWTTTAGAVFLANVDDDDGDGFRDADDEIINGPEDLKDLAPVKISAWPDMPDGHIGVLTLDAASADQVRIFKQTVPGGGHESYQLVGGQVGPCNHVDATCTPTPRITFTAEEMRAGVELAIEGRRFRRSLDPAEWSGQVDLGLSLETPAGERLAMDGLTDGVDAVKMKVAPWVMVGNLTPGIDRLYADTVYRDFDFDVTQVTRAAEVEHLAIDNYGDDQWTQDYFQTGWTSMPIGGGKVHGMRIANPRPWGRTSRERDLPIYWLIENYLGPDRGVVRVYDQAGSGDSFDSHGNHEMLPPYQNGSESFPVGRILHGSGILPETRAFYAAQEVQGPPLVIDTSWLLVGHADEVVSTVPAATPRGWKLLIALPRLARELLQTAQAGGFGQSRMFQGLTDWDGRAVDTSVDEVLADTDLMGASDAAQAHIDGVRDTIQQAVGLTDDEIVEVPVLFFAEMGHLIAYTPSAVNVIVFGNHVSVSEPYGPDAGGVDPFKAEMERRLGTAKLAIGQTGQGMAVHFVRDWYYYHLLDGEVHCGSNWDAPPPAEQKWWEVAR